MQGVHLAVRTANRKIAHLLSQLVAESLTLFIVVAGGILKLGLRLR